MLTAKEIAAIVDALELSLSASTIPGELYIEMLHDPELHERILKHEKWEAWIKKLIAKVKRPDKYKVTLKTIARTCIKRDKKRNACWLAGEAAVVHLIEDVLGKKSNKKFNKKFNKKSKL